MADRHGVIRQEVHSTMILKRPHPFSPPVGTALSGDTLTITGVAADDGKNVYHSVRMDATGLTGWVRTAAIEETGIGIK